MLTLKKNMCLQHPRNSRPSKVDAEDLDGDDTDDGRVSYSIRGGDGLGSFMVNEEGNIRTLAVLDAESKDHYWLTVHATDHGAVPLSSKLFVYVQVQDTNDNAPFLNMPDGLVWYENQPPGEVGALVAEDYDTLENGPPFRFSLDPAASPSIRKQFSVKQKPSASILDNNFYLHTETTFDREQQKEYSIPIR